MFTDKLNIALLFLAFSCPSLGVPVEEDLSLTLKEKNALDELKPIIIPLLPHDYMKREIYLIKFLRAANLNVKTAYNQMQKTLEWRETNNMDGILDEDFSDMEEEFPATTSIRDFSGRPVLAADASSWDVRRAVVTGKGDKMIRYIYRLIEAMARKIYAAQSRGENVTQGSVLLNLKGFSLITHGCPRCIPLYVNLLISYEQYYPGLVHKYVIINTPASFEIVLSALRPFMSKSTKQALAIFGNNRGEWAKYILNMIPANELDTHLGGNKFD